MTNYSATKNAGDWNHLVSSRQFTASGDGTDGNLSFREKPSKIKENSLTNIGELGRLEWNMPAYETDHLTRGSIGTGVTHSTGLKSGKRRFVSEPVRTGHLKQEVNLTLCNVTTRSCLDTELLE